MITRRYDFVAIGGGPAGQRGAIQAAKEGAKTALIDRRPRVGGVSLHTGTVPSKTLREAVMYLSGLRQRHYYGESYKVRHDISLQDLQLRVNKVLNQEIKVMDDQLRRNNVNVIQGQASFKDPHTIQISSLDNELVEEVIADEILIAVGTVPRRPEGIPFDQEVIFDSNFIFSSKNKRDSLPQSLIVVGAGIIGMEYACMFAALGCDVWLVDRRSEPFRILDCDIYDQLLQTLTNLGIHIVFGGEVGAITRTDRKRGRVGIEGFQTLEADAVLLAPGRTPCTYTLNLEHTGVETSPNGQIIVNDQFQTRESHIYAAGDVIGFPALASTSAEQGRMAARNALGLEVSSRPELFPFAIYTIPEISWVGKTEQELLNEKIPVVRGVAFYREIPKAAIIGDVEGALKILFHRETRKILGVHLIGDLASELIHIAVIAMNQDGKLDLFIDNVFNFPTLAEAFKIAALNGMNQLELNPACC